MPKLSLQEFLSQNRFLELKNKRGSVARRYKLGNYTILYQNAVYLEFATDEHPNGLENFVNRLSNNDPMACLKGLYLLIQDKEDFPLFSDFTKMLDSYDAPLHELQLLLMQIINESLPVYKKKRLRIALMKGVILLTCAITLYLM